LPAVEELRAGAADRSVHGGRRYTTEILLISFAALLLEIAYTRIISFKLYYYWVFLVIGLALLGIGSGGVFVVLSKRLKRAELDSIIRWGCLWGAFTIGVGYLVVATTPIDTLAIWDYGTRASVTNLFRLVVICLALFASFVAIGVMISALFARRPQHISRLYFADLLGAGLACAVVVALLATVGPPVTIMLAGVVLAALGLRQSIGHGRTALAVGAGLTVVLLATAVFPALLPEISADGVKNELGADVTRYSSWSPVFRVDAVDANEDLRFLFHDGLLGSAIYRYDGDPTTLTRFEGDPRSFPFTVLGDPAERVMIIGAAGGNEVLASLYFDAGQVDAIELNPVTHSLVTDEFADYAGNLADDPRVDYRQGDGRSFLARSDDEYDLVWFPAPDSYSATNAASAGAFVLSESYLYTSETVSESLDHLGGDGILAAQFGEFDYEARPNRTARYVTTARAALADRGITDPTDHILVATTPAVGTGGTLSTILVKEAPFTAEEVGRFTAVVTDAEDGTVRHAPGDAYRANLVGNLVTASGAEMDDLLADYPFAVGEISDNGPFFWHFSSFGDVIASFTEPINRQDLELAIGERVLLLLLGVATLMAAVFLLLPFVAVRKTFADMPRKGLSFLYFACLGLGFLFFEITLIQRLTLFLGYPTYSLSVTLASILVFTGVGAWLSGRYEHQRERVIPALMGAVVTIAVLAGIALPALTDALLGTPLTVRIIVTVLVLAPLGLCLGTFMPVGLRAVAQLSDHRTEYVAWGWAVNGFASVIGSVLTTLLAMTFGFDTVLVIAVITYLVALAALYRLLGPTVRAA
jgi:MFS family permease